jgi:uncharacterized 2Fe-2S/4Fe-4S cluster protein (DUF4445 family)
MKVTLTDGRILEIKEGETLYKAFTRQEVYLTASCGGKGVCGKCKVRIIEGAFECRNYGKLTPEERQQGIVLACQSVAHSDLSVEIPEESKLIVGDKIAISRTKDLYKILKEYGAEPSSLISKVSLQLPHPTLDDNLGDLERIKRKLQDHGLLLKFPKRFVDSLAEQLRSSNWSVNLCWQKDNGEALFVEPQRQRKSYGLAVDIGTTTVVVYLVDMDSGKVLDVGSTYNSQIRYGDDVIARIVNATEGGMLSELRRVVVTDINDLLETILRRKGINRNEVESMVVSGNTTMIHLFWGLNPEYIRLEPYIPTVNIFPVWYARDAGVRINPDAPVYTLPCVASYVGGDIVSGVLATGIHRRPELSLFMDIGTNGEIVVGNNEWLMTAACSAGPCFEGSGIKCGMRATDGAIESVSIDPETLEPEIKIIGDRKPIGICGSGMIDAVAEMLLKGVIDQKGKLQDAPRVRESEEGPEYLFYADSGREIVLTQADLDNLIRAKGAIYAGVSLMLKEVGLDVEMIERVYIAGGFGNYIDVRKAIIMGMLPDLPEDRFHFVGNTSVAGAYLCLLSEDMRKEAERVASMMTYVELSMKSNYMDEFMSALFLPHTDISLFPSVKKKLKI